MGFGKAGYVFGLLFSLGGLAGCLLYNRFLLRMSKNVYEIVQGNKVSVLKCEEIIENDENFFENKQENEQNSDDNSIVLEENEEFKAIK